MIVTAIDGHKIKIHLDDLLKQVIPAGTELKNINSSTLEKIPGAVELAKQSSQKGKLMLIGEDLISNGSNGSRNYLLNTQYLFYLGSKGLFISYVPSTFSQTLKKKLYADIQSTINPITKESETLVVKINPHKSNLQCEIQNMNSLEIKPFNLKKTSKPQKYVSPCIGNKHATAPRTEITLPHINLCDRQLFEKYFQQISALNFRTDALKITIPREYLPRPDLTNLNTEVQFHNPDYIGVTGKPKLIGKLTRTSKQEIVDKFCEQYVLDQTKKIVERTIRQLPKETFAGSLWKPEKRNIELNLTQLKQESFEIGGYPELKDTNEAFRARIYHNNMGLTPTPFRFYFLRALVGSNAGEIWIQPRLDQDQTGDLLLQHEALRGVTKTLEEIFPIAKQAAKTKLIYDNY